MPKLTLYISSVFDTGNLLNSQSSGKHRAPDVWVPGKQNFTHAMKSIPRGRNVAIVTQCWKAPGKSTPGFLSSHLVFSLG